MAGDRDGRSGPNDSNAPLDVLADADEDGWAAAIDEWDRALALPAEESVPSAEAETAVRGPGTHGDLTPLTRPRIVSVLCFLPPGPIAQGCREGTPFAEPSP